MVKVSVIIPCRNEVKYISGCLDSVVNCNYPKNLLEVIVVDGISSDGTVDIIKDYITRFDFIKLFENKHKTVPYAMNLGIQHSSGEYIIRLDAHSEYPPDYFSTLISWGQKLNSDNIGTVCLTRVKNITPKTYSIMKVLSNKLGVGNSYFRIGTKEVKEVDTVPFGCYKRNVFEKVGLFNENLCRNQDIELNKRIIHTGGKIFLLPNLYSIYYARETYRELSKNHYSTGLWNILTIYYTKKISSLSIRHFIPLVFLLSLIVPLLFLSKYPLLLTISLLSFTSYFLAVFFVAKKNNDAETTIYHLIISFFIVHFSYGFGSLIGLLNVPILFRKKSEIRYL